MDTLNDLNERVDAFVGTSSFDTPAAANDQAPIDVPAEVHEDIVASPTCCCNNFEVQNYCFSSEIP